jgi:hypothetical protein
LSKTAADLVMRSRLNADVNSSTLGGRERGGRGGKQVRVCQDKDTTVWLGSKVCRQGMAGW